LSIAQAKYNQALKDFGPNTTQVASAHVTLERAQRAVSKAASGATGQLSQQQKVMATMSIIMRDSRDAQGDFARTSGGLANQQRILRAEITNLEEKLGKTLLPTVLRLVTRMTDWLSSTQNQERLIRRLSTTVSTAATVIKTMFDVMRGAADLVGGWKNLAIAIGIATVASKAFFVAMRVQAALTAVAIRATLISTGIGALAVAFGVAVAEIIAHWKTVRRFLADSVAFFKRVGLNIVLSLVEPFSHLPGRMGAWARRAKTRVEDELYAMRNAKRIQDAATGVGNMFGRTLFDRMVFWAQKAAGATASTLGSTVAGAAAGRGTGTGAAAGAAGAAGAAAGGAGAGGIQGGLVKTGMTALGNPYRYGGAPSLARRPTAPG
jgi:hypothetical protein